MHVGIDFDNTIVCYDRLFHKVCFEAGLIPQEIPPNKSAVRDYLRAEGKEDDWTEMQGLVYGPRIVEANPFEGVRSFIKTVKSSGHCVSVVSHKTKYPYRGEQHDLHAAAMEFLEEHGFFQNDLLSADHVYLEPSKESKANRIGEIKCDWFIDDLPEFLKMVKKPEGIKRVLFDPNDVHENSPSWSRVSSWAEITEVIC